MPKVTDSNQTQSTSQGINISTLRRKRGNIIGHITTFARLVENSQHPEQCDVGLLRAHLDSLKEIYARFDDIQSELEELDESEGPRRYEIHNDYVAIIARANVLIQPQYGNLPSRRNTTDSSATSVTAPMAIKLPEMRLPTFDGEIEKWASYFDSFSSMIDQNMDLTPVQKLQYLRSTLTGKAAACIECLSTTDANYSDAIELLKEKFDCKRRVLLKHCNAIRAIPKLSTDSPESLGNLVDTIRQNLRALKNLGINVASWDCILISIILWKINPDTAWHWELSLRDKQMPSYNHLLDFLEKRANCAAVPQRRSVAASEPHNRSSSAKSPSNKRPTRNYAFVTATNSQESDQQHDHRRTYETPATPSRCPICQDTHCIWRCEKFHSLSVEKRTAAVRKAVLCSNCLRADHNQETCKRGACRICNKYHHTLLHQPKRSPNRTTSPSERVTPAGSQSETSD
ncbi:uncharacterized protein LOC143364562 [Halictus rubicundus]|uniref:uncharacterized protein LOC143364562 n=1 Tax=Halictus rubicundus TaxID=77578 RepID=UPI00403643B8